jgi:serine/threonine protein kinase
VTAGQLLTGAAGRYRLEEERASGGFGTTYLARREEDGRAVLVKVLRLDRMKQWKALELFHREAAVLRQLSHPRHPRLPRRDRAGDARRTRGPGPGRGAGAGAPDLAALMRSGARADRERLLEWMEQLLRVLVYLHQQAPPVIHRDISPKNIVLRPDGRVALVDFGSVQAALQRDQSVASTAAGTFGFAPMEQFVGRASPSSDLYALGMTFLALATGLPPEQMPLDGIRVDVRALLGGDPRLVRLLEAMTAADPRERLGDAAAALRQLGAIRQGKDPGALETREGTGPGGWARPRGSSSSRDPRRGAVRGPRGLLGLLRARPGPTT